MERAVELQPNFDYATSVEEILESSLKFGEADQIGRGTFAVVYKATHKTFGTVAYKKFKTRFESVLENKERHRLREVSVMASDLIRDKRDMFVHCFAKVVAKEKERECGLIFELMHGDLYKTVLSKDANVDYSEIEMCLWGWQIARGLLFLHENNLIHRDIKPDNIFIDDKRTMCKIGDFGIITKSDITTTYNGSINYCAPELMDKEDKYHFTFATDVYSFGVTLKEIAHPVREEAPIKSNPAFLDPLIEKCCAREGVDRPNIKEIVDVLEGKKNNYRRPEVDIMTSLS